MTVHEFIITVRRDSRCFTSFEMDIILYLTSNTERQDAFNKRLVEKGNERHVFHRRKPAPELISLQRFCSLSKELNKAYLASYIRKNAIVIVCKIK